MKKRILLAVLMFAGSSVVFAQEKNITAGADKDSHGCKASAGYTYSELKKDCIRSFEQKIQLKEIASKGGFSAAVIFNKDKSKAEIFLKEEKNSVVLKAGKKGTWQNDSYVLTENKGFSLSKNKKTIYKS